MSVQPNVFSRIGQWITGKSSSETTQPGEAEVQASQTLVPTQVEPQRTSIFPWARRDAAIAGLQQGVQSLSALMDTIRENLEKQSQRQDEMLSHLSHLPEILQSLPESQRIHGETLKSIGQQLEQQIVQQQQLTEILSRVGDANADQKQLLESLHERAETLHEHNEAISENLKQVGSAMQNVGRSAESSTQLLQHLREQQSNQQETMAQQQDRMVQQQEALAELVRRQDKRFTLLMVVTIVLAVAALGAAGVVTYLLFHRPIS